MSKRKDRTRRRRVHGACYSGSRTFALYHRRPRRWESPSPHVGLSALEPTEAENCITYASVYFTPRGWHPGGAAHACHGRPRARGLVSPLPFPLSGVG
uniref:Uncharacterized protein n=1 Tax=Knipowitschia caucasica TaxID=637954 RepID=A0AAV2K335_KNICA